MIDTDWSEHYIKRGDPSKPTYFIIRRKAETTGLFVRYAAFSGQIRRALSNGWLPVIDMQNYPNIYLAPEKLGLLKVKPALMEEISAVRQKLFAPNERVLGVLLRGTDYITKRPEGHAILPPTEFAASIVVEKIQQWQCNRMFLATEDKTIVQAFKQIFGDFCVTFDREYVDYDYNQQQAVGLVRIDRPNDHYIQGKDYLTQIVLASMCNSFVAARCSGSIGVMMMAEKFEHTYFFNLGRYGVIGLD